MHKRNITADFLRGVATLLVVVGHFSPMSYIGCVIYSFHMAIFFFLAGYFCKITVEPIYIYKRVRGVFVPYLFTRFVGIITQLIHGQQIDVKNIFCDVFLFGGNCWFLYCLFFMELAFWIIYVIYRHFFKKECFDIIVVLLAIGSVFYKILGCHLTNYFSFERIVYWVFYFFAGYLISNIIVLKKYVKKNKWKFLILAFFLFSGINFLNAGRKWNDYESINFDTYIVALSGIFISYILSEKFCKRNCVCKIMQHFSKYSLQYYILPVNIFGVFSVMKFSNTILAFLYYMLYQILERFFLIKLIRKNKVFCFFYNIK